jgi:CubicO group peptidase (beta-lactamase class C family)
MSFDMHVGGYVAQGFEAVRDAFAANLSNGEELGATFSVVKDGQTIVDLYGGVRNEEKSEALGPDDLFNVWSTTKGLCALCLAMAVDRGLIDYAAPVAHYWPEFGVNGKDQISVETLLSHRGGITGAYWEATEADMADNRAYAARLATQAPLYGPGKESAYNAGIFGLWVNELLIRTDGRSVAQFFREEVAIPLDVDVWIALPEAHHHRRAPMVAPWATMAATMPIPTDPVVAASMSNPRTNPLRANTPAFMSRGNGSGDGSANARGLARIYGALARGGEIDGVRLISPEGLAKATAERHGGKDRVFTVYTRWAAGFLLNNRGMYGQCDNAFGHTGLGGSFAFADPDAKLGVSYAMNLMAANLMGDQRGARLVAATYACLRGRGLNPQRPYA